MISKKKKENKKERKPVRCLEGLHSERVWQQCVPTQCKCACKYLWNFRLPNRTQGLIVPICAQPKSTAAAQAAVKELTVPIQVLILPLWSFPLTGRKGGAHVVLEAICICPTLRPHPPSSLFTAVCSSQAFRRTWYSGSALCPSFSAIRPWCIALHCFLCARESWGEVGAWRGEKNGAWGLGGGEGCLLAYLVWVRQRLLSNCQPMM